MDPINVDGVRKDLLNLIKQHGELSLDDAIPRMKLAKTTIRQHLLVLESQGLIHRRYEGLGQGRPRIIFELSTSGQSLYPTREPLLFNELLGYLNSSGLEHAVEGFFTQYWEKRKLQFQAIFKSLNRIGKASEQKNRLEALRTVLELEGFMPKVERLQGNVVIRKCHCPIPEAVRATRLPCQLETAFIQWALKADIARVRHIASGDSSCTYSVLKTQAR